LCTGRHPWGFAKDGARLLACILEREAIDEPNRFNGYRSQSKHGIRDGHATVASGSIGVHLCQDQKGVRSAANIHKYEVVTVGTGGVQSQSDLFLVSGTYAYPDDQGTGVTL
jgi:hypothetical protein